MGGWGYGALDVYAKLIRKRSGHSGKRTCTLYQNQSILIIKLPSF